MTYYKDYNDYELVSLAQELNEDAINIIYEKYKPIIYKKSRKYLPLLKGIELCDLVQECYIILDYAIKHFNQDNNNTFYTFFIVCLDRYLLNEYKKNNNSKNKILNESISLDSTNEDDNSLLDLIMDTTTPELELTSNEEVINLYNKILNKLTNLEECVFILKINNFSYKEIADVLDKDIKSIDNAIQRIKNKINNLNISYKG